VNIRTKTLSITGIAVLCVLAIIYIVATPLILKDFVKVEDKDVRQNVGRATDAVQAQIDALAFKTFDWASWDDPYDFIAGVKNNFIESNFGGDDQYENPVFDTILYYNSAGKLVYSNGGIKPPQELLDQLKPGNPLLKYGSGEIQNAETADVRGIIKLKNDLLLVTARPVLHNDSSGPSHGTVMLMSYLDNDAQQALATTTHLNMHIYDLSDPNIPSAVATVQQELANREIRVSVQDGTHINGYTYLHDISGNPAALVAVEQPRNIYEQGKASVRTFSYIILGIGIAFITLTFITLELFVLRRIVALTNHVAAIRDGGSGDNPLNFPGKDEVSRLATGINHMLMRVKESNLRVHSLVTQLEHEKEGVQRLVRQRTIQLEEEKTRFLASISSLPLGFVLLDNNGKILMLNPTIEKMLHMTVANVSAMVTGDGRKDNVLEKIIDRAQQVSRKHHVSSLELTTPDGRYLHTLISPVVTRRGDVDGVVVLVEDVTEARILDRSKEEFFSIASHELRTPLTAIRGNASLIQQFYKEQMKDESLASMVGDIHTSSVRLIEIVNDFLDASSLEQGKMKFTYEDFDVQDVIDKVVDELGAVTAEKNIHLKTHQSSGVPIVHSDANRIKQVIYNLIGNAVKFTDKGSVTIATEIVSENQIKISVSDTGPGISAEGQHILFHKFQQGGNDLHTRDATRGTGLGLYISKLIIEQLGGHISLDHSEQGDHHGTTFSITLPFQPRHHD
jgi:two-component system phosphate regulon sensor histidine kinase PhoR